MAAPPLSPDHAHTHLLRVRYGETDQMGVAHHGSYVAWIEEGRTEWLRSAGRDYRSLEEEGVFLAVTGLSIRFRGPARYDDLLAVRTRLAAMGRASLRFAYEIRREGEAGLLARAETELACVDGKGRPRRLPEGLFPRVAAASGERTRARGPSKGG